MSDLFAERSADAAPSPSLAGDAHTVAQAIALHWTWRPRTACIELLRQRGARSASGRAFSQEATKPAYEELKRAGLLIEHPARLGYWRLTDPARAAVYRQLLETSSIDALRDALHQAERYTAGRGSHHWPLWDIAPTVAIVRLEFFAGTSRRDLEALQQQVSRSHDWSRVLQEACLEGFDAASFERIAADVRWDLGYAAVSDFCDRWRTELLPFCDWLLGKLESAPRERAAIPDHLRLILAELLLHRGESARAVVVLEGDASGAADALRAAALVHEGRWAAAQSAFEAAFKKRQTELSARKRLVPARLAWLYPLALLAQQTPQHFDTAKRFCLGEAGKRNPNPYEHWGTWVHAIAARLGDAPLDPTVFGLTPEYLSWRDLWGSLLRAWLGAEAIRTAHGKHDPRRDKRVAALRQRLQACGFAWLDAQVAAAESVFAGDAPPAHFFVTGEQEAWRGVLASLQALGADSAVPSERAATRIVWSIRLDKQGAIESIEPTEQKRGVRGWGKPTALTLAKLARNERLEPWDARVARAVRLEGGRSRRYVLDRAAAIVALVGHPAVVMDDAPEITVDVVEGTPELDVARAGDQFVMRIHPAPRAAADTELYAYYVDGAEAREHEALRSITVLRDTPQRVRVIRFTAAQRRAAQLVSGRFSVPAAAHAELQDALRSLAGHFRIESDHARAAREVPAETRLRAELAPSGESLLLRLVAAPLGADGPRLMPGAGRALVMAAVKGETVGAERDLAAERAHLDAVLAAFEFLDPPARGDVVCEWRLDEPDRALALVEALPNLAAVLAIDWPSGQSVRVITVDAARLSVSVRTERDWFRVEGRAAIDEQMVFDLETLLAAAAKPSRFVPMGKGVYAALTRELRDKLAELAAVAQWRDGALRVPPLAAGWLEEVLAGTTTQTDAGFSARLEQLRTAHASLPALPGGLQAQLRPYQEDGYVWAMRLAQSGFGACLADDMGLGKTVQTLAVLLARAAVGPALVIAPTSVCGNWLAETRRFAPSLNAMIYGEGEGDRETMVESAGPRDVVIVSYALMQQARESFAAKTWHTLVADEAQAVKNAAAKRSLALFELPADFRLALSGTPIENRLAELWSIMHFCNQGLLGPLARFNERFAGPIERERNRDAQRILRRLIAPFLLRRTKSQVLQDLPPRTELALAIEAEPAEAAHYEALRRAAVATAESAAASESGGQAQFHILAQLTRLRRAACDPRLVSPELGIVGAKVRAFADLATELTANGHKALVFSQFVDFLALLRAPLDEAGIAYQYLDGATPAAERTRRVAAFQGGAGDLFLISLKAGGFGLNLTAADYVVITDPWWNPAAEDQALGRAHRIGQARPVTVYRLVSKGTLEESIVRLHHDKRALAEGMLDEQGAGAALPSTAELIALMRGD